MKRALPFVLLVIFLFNQVGYYGVHWLTLRHHQSETLRKLDNNEVDGFRTVTLKIPLAVPYPAARSEYERIKGAFEHRGERYKLVQQKLENDTLYIVCIRDVNEERLQHALNDFVKLSHDNTTDSKSFKLLNSFCKDFHHTHQPGLLHASGWSLALTHLYTFSALRSSLRTIFVPPPKLVCIV